MRLLVVSGIGVLFACSASSPMTPPYTRHPTDALVEVPYWGMENSTCTAYGSSFPTWAKQHGEKDRWAIMDRFYDYILIHESAHEWWGNSITSNDLADMWVQIEALRLLAYRAAATAIDGRFPRLAEVTQASLPSGVTTLSGYRRYSCCGP